jgi:hypothetical protein
MEEMAPIGVLMPTAGVKATLIERKRFILSVLSRNKALTFGQVSVKVQSRYGVYVSPDEIRKILWQNPTVEKSYTDEWKVKKASITLMDFLTPI